MLEYDADGDDVEVDIDIEEDRGESVDLRPLPEPPDSEATKTVAAEEWAKLTSMAAAISIRPSCCTKEKNRRKEAGRANHELGQVLSLMGQA